MKDNYKKVDSLRVFIHGWIHEEASQDPLERTPIEGTPLGEVYEKRKRKLNMLAGPDIEYLNEINRDHRWNKLTKNNESRKVLFYNYNKGKKKQTRKKKHKKKPKKTINKNKNKKKKKTKSSK